MYIDVPTSTNLVRDDKIILTVVASQATVTMTDQILTFSIVAGVYTITAANLTAALFAVGDQIIIRGSVDTTGLINNDGLYTVVTNPEGSITVEEPVKACASVGAATVDEYDTFILHPTKRIEQVCVFIVVGATPATCQVSFKPGGFWAAGTKIGLPLMQGLLATANSYFVQVESAKYLQTVSEILTGEINRKGTLLMRVFPVASAALTAEVDVALIQLY